MENSPTNDFLRAFCKLFYVELRVSNDQWFLNWETSLHENNCNDSSCKVIYSYGDVPEFTTSKSQI